MTYHTEAAQPETPPAPVSKTESTASLKAAIASTFETTAGGVVQDDPRDREEYTFDCVYVDRRKKRWKGSFRNKILSIAQQQDAAVLQARMQGGLPSTAIASDVQEMNYAVAWMEYSLVDRPSWAEDLREMLDRDLILYLWKEVNGHEATFWRLGADSEASGK